MLRHHSEGALTSVQYTLYSIHKYTQVIREGFDKCAVEFREARALCSYPDSSHLNGLQADDMFIAKEP